MLPHIKKKTDIEFPSGLCVDLNGASLPSTNRLGEPIKVYIVAVSLYKKKADGLVAQACKDNADGCGSM